MYLIAQLFNAMTDRIKAKCSTKVDVQFWNGDLDKILKMTATGNFLVMMDFPEIQFSSSGAGYGGQLATINFDLMLVIRDQEDTIKHMRHLDTIVRSLHAWTPVKEAADNIEGWTALMRVSMGVDARFDFPRVYRIGYRTTARDVNSEAFEWSKTNYDEETATDLAIEVKAPTEVLPG